MSERAPTLLAACAGRVPGRDDWPSVSVVVPVRNEGPFLDAAVASILAQDYPERFDVCLAVAPSDDDTEAVAARIAADDPRVSIVQNPHGVTPSGLNAAIAATTGSIVVRVDGHAALSPGYVRRAVETMCRTGAVNVGGRQLPAPETGFERAVAAATTSWLGTGGATYRVGGAAGPVDTVYLGVFDRRAGDLVGWFDENLIRNQDYELNIRLREAGGVVWFEPELSVSYRPRGSWRALTRQYYEYGWWKSEVVRRHPRSFRLRQAVAAAAPAAIAGCAVSAVVRPRLAIVPVGYLAAIAGAASLRRANASAAMIAGVAMAQHFAWSAGFMNGALRPRRTPSVEPWP